MCWVLGLERNIHSEISLTRPPWMTVGQKVWISASIFDMYPVAFEANGFEMKQKTRNLKHASGPKMTAVNIDLHVSQPFFWFLQGGVKKCRIWPSRNSGFETKQQIAHLKQIWRVHDGLLTCPNLVQFGLVNSETRGYKITQIYVRK